MHWHRSRKFLIIVALITLALTSLPMAMAHQDVDSGKIEQGLRTRLAEEGPLDLVVIFGEHPDLSAASTMDWNERGWFVYNALTQVANRSQAEAKSYLEKRGRAYQSFFSANTLYVWKGDLATVNALADMPEVAYIRAGRTYQLPEEPKTAATAPETLEWGLVDVEADQFWSAFGRQGDGIIVANIDSGVRHTHEALFSQYRCGAGPHTDCWFDPYNGTTTPSDWHDHGSHTMGTMLGLAGSNEIGMAPNATWIACLGFPPTGATDPGLLACGDWVINPGGSPDNRPHVVNNSWSSNLPGCYDWYLNTVQSWRDAGMFPAFSAGNNTGCSSLGSPGAYQISFASTAHDINRNHYYSQGPVADQPPACHPHEPYTKPNLSAPGYNVRSAGGSSDDEYVSINGTSMSCPHTAGAVALLWSCNPSLIGQIDQTFQALQDNADPPVPPNPGCGVPPDGEGTYEDGYGYLDIYRAGLAWCSQTGYLDGYVTDTDTGDPIEGAAVTAVPAIQRNSINATTDPTGYYTMTLLAGTYDVTAAHPQYIAQTATGVEILEDQTTSQDFALEAKVAFTPRPLHVTVDWQSTYNELATLTNHMAGPYDFAFVEVPGGFVPGLAQYPVYIPRFTGEISPGDAAPSTALAPTGLEPLPAPPAEPFDLSLLANPAYGHESYPNNHLWYWPDLEDVGTWSAIGPLDNFFPAGDFLNNDYSKQYVLHYTTNEFATIDTATAVKTTIANTSPNGPWAGMTAAPDGTLYASSSNCGSDSTLYTIDPATGALTEIGQTAGATCLIDIAYNPADDMIYGVDIVSDQLVRIDPASANTGIIGSIGFDANYAQSMDFDDSNGILYYAAFNAGLFQGELRIADINTGATALVGPLGVTNTEVTAYSIVAQDVPWFGQDPVAGTVPAGDSIQPTMRFTATTDAGVTQPGDYFCNLNVSGEPALSVRVTMTVLPGADLGQLHGYVLDNCTGEPVEAHIEIAGGDPITETWSDPATGYYSAWLYSGTYDLSFNAVDYLTHDEPGVTVVEGEETVLDVDLVPDRPCIAVDPEMFEVWLVTGTLVYTHPAGLDIYNDGGQTLDFEIVEVSGTLSLQVASTASPRPENKGALRSDDLAAFPVVPSKPSHRPMATGVLLIQDSVAWSYPAMTTTLDANGIPYDVINSDQIDTWNLFPYKMILIPSVQGSAYNTAFNDNLAKFEAFIDAGGIVVMGLCTQISHTPYIQPPFGGTNNYQTADDNHIEDPSHPIFAGVTNPYSGTSASHNYLSNLLPDDRVLVTQGTTSGGNVVMIERDHGAGMLVAGGQTFEWGWGKSEGAGQILENMIPYYYFNWEPAGGVPWVWEEPVSGTVPAQDMTNVDIMFSTYNDYPTATVQLPPGTYSATLIFKSSAIGTGRAKIPTIMHILDQPITPTAAFTDTSPVCVDTAMAFSFTGDPGLPAADSYHWDFGDGISMTMPGPGPVTHTYSTPGTYTATLEVCITALGVCDMAMDTVEVLPGPTAGFSWSAVTLTVSFANESTDADTYLWDFDDGATSSETNPTHVYTAEGTYTVTLTAYGPCGEDTAVAMVAVEEAYYVYLPLVTKNYGP